MSFSLPPKPPTAPNQTSEPKSGAPKNTPKSQETRSQNQNQFGVRPVNNYNSPGFDLPVFPTIRPASFSTPHNIKPSGGVQVQPTKGEMYDEIQQKINDSRRLKPGSRSTTSQENGNRKSNSTQQKKPQSKSPSPSPSSNTKFTSMPPPMAIPKNDTPTDLIDTYPYISIPLYSCGVDVLETFEERARKVAADLKGRPDFEYLLIDNFPRFAKVKDLETFLDWVREMSFYKIRYSVSDERIFPALFLAFDKIFEPKEAIFMTVLKDHIRIENGRIRWMDIIVICTSKISARKIEPEMTPAETKVLKDELHIDDSPYIDSAGRFVSNPVPMDLALPRLPLNVLNAEPRLLNPFYCKDNNFEQFEQRASTLEKDLLSLPDQKYHDPANYPSYYNIVDQESLLTWILDMTEYKLKYTVSDMLIYPILCFAINKAMVPWNQSILIEMRDLVVSKYDKSGIIDWQYILCILYHVPFEMIPNTNSEGTLSNSGSTLEPSPKGNAIPLSSVKKKDSSKGPIPKAASLAPLPKSCLDFHGTVILNPPPTNLPYPQINPDVYRRHPRLHNVFYTHDVQLLEAFELRALKIEADLKGKPDYELHKAENFPSHSSVRDAKSFFEWIYEMAEYKHKYTVSDDLIYPTLVLANSQIPRQSFRNKLLNDELVYDVRSEMICTKRIYWSKIFSLVGSGETKTEKNPKNSSTGAANRRSDQTSKTNVYREESSKAIQINKSEKKSSPNEDYLDSQGCFICIPPALNLPTPILPKEVLRALPQLRNPFNNEGPHLDEFEIRARKVESDLQGMEDYRYHEGKNLPGFGRIDMPERFMGWLVRITKYKQKYTISDSTIYSRLVQATFKSKEPEVVKFMQEIRHDLGKFMQDKKRICWQKLFTKVGIKILAARKDSAVALDTLRDSITVNSSRNDDTKESRSQTSSPKIVSPSPPSSGLPTPPKEHSPIAKVSPTLPKSGRNFEGQFTSSPPPMALPTPKISVNLVGIDLSFIDPFFSDDLTMLYKFEMRALQIQQVFHEQPFMENHKRENFASPKVHDFETLCYWIRYLTNLKLQYSVPDYVLLPALIDTILLAEDGPMLFHLLELEQNFSKIGRINWKMVMCYAFLAMNPEEIFVPFYEACSIEHRRKRFKHITPDTRLVNEEKWEKYLKNEAKRLEMQEKEHSSQIVENRDQIKEMIAHATMMNQVSARNSSAVSKSTPGSIKISAAEPPEPVKSKAGQQKQDKKVGSGSSKYSYGSGFLLRQPAGSNSQGLKSNVNNLVKETKITPSRESSTTLSKSDHSNSSGSTSHSASQSHSQKNTTNSDSKNVLEKSTDSIDSSLNLALHKLEQAGTLAADKNVKLSSAESVALGQYVNDPKYIRKASDRKALSVSSLVSLAKYQAWDDIPVFTSSNVPQPTQELLDLIEKAPPLDTGLSRLEQFDIAHFKRKFMKTKEKEQEEENRYEAKTDNIGDVQASGANEAVKKSTKDQANEPNKKEPTKTTSKNTNGQVSIPESVISITNPRYNQDYLSSDISFEFDEDLIDHYETIIGLNYELQRLQALAPSAAQKRSLEAVAAQHKEQRELIVENNVADRAAYLKNPENFSDSMMKVQPYIDNIMDDPYYLQRFHDNAFIEKKKQICKIYQLSLRYHDTNPPSEKTQSIIAKFDDQALKLARELQKMEDAKVYHRPKYPGFQDYPMF